MTSEAVPTGKVKLLYAALYVALELMTLEQASLTMNDPELPPLQKLVSTISAHFKGITPQRALDKWRWLTRDSSDKMIERYIAQHDSLVKSANAIGATIKWAIDINIERELRRGERYYIETEPDERYIDQYKVGKAMLWGTDKQKRPLVIVRARFHKARNQSNAAARRLVTTCFENSFLAQKDSEDGATLIFDLAHWGIDAMDYPLIKCVIEHANRYYPRLLSTILIHNSPRLFEVVWKIIKPWMNPEIAEKIRFTYDTRHLLRYVHSDQLPQFLGGTSNYDPVWFDPRPEDDLMLREFRGRTFLTNERKALMVELETLTCEWILDESNFDLRENVLSLAKLNYWTLDPYVRSRTIWDRHGVMGVCRPELAQGGIAQPTCVVHRPTVSASSKSISPATSVLSFDTFRFGIMRRKSIY